MNTDFRIKIGFSRHTKTLKLKRRLGAEGVLALIALWEYTALNKSDGCLSGMDSEDIALAVGWEGDSEHLVQTLVTVGWLDETPDGYRVHDWEQHNDWAAKATDRSAYFRDLAAKRRRKGRLPDNGGGKNDTLSDLHNDTHSDTLSDPHNDTLNDTLSDTLSDPLTVRHAPLPSSPLPSSPLLSSPIPSHPRRVLSESLPGEGEKTVKAPGGADADSFAYPPEFEQVWNLYPARAGGNSKRSAYRAWRARIKEGISAEALQAGTARYAAFCAATGKVGTEYVKQAGTFYGPDQHFRSSWTPPAQQSIKSAKAPGETVGPWSGLGTHGANTARSALELLRRDGLWPPPEAAH